MTSHSSDVLPFKAKYSDKFTVRTEADRATCSIAGLVCMPDDRMVCIDNSNHRIKVFNAECQHSFSKDVDSSCKDLALVSDIDVATGQDSAIVLFVIGENEISQRKKKIRAEGKVLAISFADDNFAVLSERETKHVQIITRDGHCSQNFKIKDLSDTIRDVIEFIRFDHSGSNFHIIDNVGRTYCFTLEGTSLWSTIVPGSPVSGMVLNNELVLVCGRSSSIVAVDSHGSLSKTMVEDKTRIVDGRHICYQNGPRVIILSQKDSDFVHKYVLYRF